MGLVADARGGRGEVDIPPVREHDFLLTLSGYQEVPEPHPFFFVAGSEQLVEVLRLVNLRLLLDVPRPVVFAHESGDPLLLLERRHDLKFVIHAALPLLFLFSQEGSKLQQVSAVISSRVSLWQDSVK